MSTSDTISNLDAVFGRMAWLCSRREYCSAAVLGKLRQKGLDDKDAAAVLERLVRERYVDDARYARAFVRDKALLSGWGPRKISFALSAKGISREVVEEALGEVSPEDSEARMCQVLSAKWKSVSGKTLYERRTCTSAAPSFCVSPFPEATPMRQYFVFWMDTVKKIAKSQYLHYAEPVGVGIVPFISYIAL